MRKPFNQDYVLTQGFGENPADYAQFGLKGHNGLDYGLPTGTVVVAPHDGKVIEAASDPTGYGNYIKIENDKEGSVLGHLQSMNVSIGQSVTEGQIIASSNNTGNSTGPHLHWGHYFFPRDRNNGYAGFTDQLPLLQPSGNMYKGYDLTNSESMKVAVDVLVRVQSGEFVDKSVYEQEVQKEKTTVDNLNQIINDKNRTISDTQGEVSSLNTQVTNLESRVTSLTEQAKHTIELEKLLKTAETSRDQCLLAQETQNKSIAQLKRTSYLTASVSVLLKEISRRFLKLGGEH